jgi:hypothetical protein
LTRSILIEIPKNIESQDDHSKSEENEARFYAEHRPVARKVGTEEVDFGNDEEDPHETGDEMGDTIKEKELSNMSAAISHQGRGARRTFEVWTVLTSMTQLATTTVRSAMMLRTRMTFRTM